MTSRFDDPESALPAQRITSVPFDFLLDRRRLVQRALAASLGGATGVGARMRVRAASATGHPDALLETAASRSSIVDVMACACLEASLHVMMH